MCVSIYVTALFRSDGYAFVCDIYTLWCVFEGGDGNIITFAQFEEGDLLSETRYNAERDDKSDDDSIMPPLLSKEDIDVVDSSD